MATQIERAQIELASLATAEDFLGKAALFESAAKSQADANIKADLLQIAECLRYLARARAGR